MADPASVRARARIRAEMEKLQLSQRDVAGILTWSQSRVSKNLNARIELGIDDLESLCFAVNISLTEAVRDQGLEFCAEMTPSELRMFQLYRSLSQDLRDSVAKILATMANASSRAEKRHASKLPQKIIRRGKHG